MGKVNDKVIAIFYQREEIFFESLHIWFTLVVGANSHDNYNSNKTSQLLRFLVKILIAKRDLFIFSSSFSHI